MDKQKIKSVPRLTTDNPVNNFQTALNFTDVSEDGWVWLRQPEMALTEYARQLVKGHGSSIDLGCNDMELSESLTDHLFDDPKQSIDGLIAEHYTILWAYATLREKLKWYEDAGIPVIPNYGLSTIRRAINRYGTPSAPDGDQGNVRAHEGDLQSPAGRNLQLPQRCEDQGRPRERQGRNRGCLHHAGAAR